MASRYIPLTESWQQVSSGVSTLQIRGGTAYISTGMAPLLDDNSKDCFIVNDSFSYSGVENVYAKIFYDPIATDVAVIVDDAFIT